jgi:hypothetical protein
MAGILKGADTTQLLITFIPLTLCLAQCEFSIKTTMYASPPMVCQLYGTGQLEPIKPVIEPTKKFIRAPIKRLETITPLQGPGFVLDDEADATSVEEPDAFKEELQFNVPCWSDCR